MASQTATKSSREREVAGQDISTSVPVNSADNPVHGKIQDRISGRAYDLYKQGGDQHGQHMQHWLRAESEILPAIPEIRESSSWFTVNVPLRGFNASEIEVSVKPDHAIIAAEKQQSSASEPGRSSDVFEQTFYTKASWPSSVEPETASAYLKNDILTLTVKRASGDSVGSKSST